MLDDLFKEFHDIVGLCRQLHSLFRHAPGNGQDRTLFWLHDRLIGRLRGSCEGVGKDGHCDRILAGDLLCKASEKLG